LIETLVGHPYIGRLRPNKHALVVDMTKSQVKRHQTYCLHWKKTMKTISRQSSNYVIQDIHIRDRLKDQELKCSNWYYCWSVTNIFIRISVVSLPKLSDIFWTHPRSVKFLYAFSIVLLMDSTYETNKYRYRLPLLEIVGETSTGLTFSAVFFLC